MEQDREVQSKLLVIAEAYLSATFGPSISDFFDLCLFSTFLVYSRVWNKRSLLNKRSPWKMWQKE